MGRRTAVQMALAHVLPRRLIDPRKIVMSSSSSHQLVAAAINDCNDVMEGLGCSRAGLSPEEAERRLAESGPNAVAAEQTHSRAQLLGKAVLNPLVILLSILAAVSLATGDVRAAVVMMLMVV